jgi:hypothetical protein
MTVNCMLAVVKAEVTLSRRDKDIHSPSSTAVIIEDLSKVDSTAMRAFKVMAEVQSGIVLYDCRPTR